MARRQRRLIVLRVSCRPHFQWFSGSMTEILCANDLEAMHWSSFLSTSTSSSYIVTSTENLRVNSTRPGTTSLETLIPFQAAILIAEIEFYTKWKPMITLRSIPQKSKTGDPKLRERDNHLIIKMLLFQRGSAFVYKACSFSKLSVKVCRTPLSYIWSFASESLFSECLILRAL